MMRPNHSQDERRAIVRRGIFGALGAAPSGLTANYLTAAMGLTSEALVVSLLPQLVAEGRVVASREPVDRTWQSRGGRTLARRCEAIVYRLAPPSVAEERP